MANRGLKSTNRATLKACFSGKNRSQIDAVTAGQKIKRLLTGLRGAPLSNIIWQEPATGRCGPPLLFFSSRRPEVRFSTASVPSDWAISIRAVRRRGAKCPLSPQSSPTFIAVTLTARLMAQKPFSEKHFRHWGLLPMKTTQEILWRKSA
jgi:hypothetical protein